MHVTHQFTVHSQGFITQTGKTIRAELLILEKNCQTRWADYPHN